MSLFLAWFVCFSYWLFNVPKAILSDPSLSFGFRYLEQLRRAEEAFTYVVDQVPSAEASHGADELYLLDNATVRENVILGKTDATKRDIEAAARAAHYAPNATTPQRLWGSKTGRLPVL